MSLSEESKKHLIKEIAEILDVESPFKTTREAVEEWLQRAAYSEQEIAIANGLCGYEKQQLRDYLLDEYGHPDGVCEEDVVRWLCVTPPDTQQRAVLAGLTRSEQEDLFNKLAATLNESTENTLHLTWEDIGKLVRDKSEGRRPRTEEAFEIIYPLISAVRARDASDNSEHARLMAKLIEGAPDTQYGYALRAFNRGKENAIYNISGAVRLLFGVEAARAVKAVLNEYPYQGKDE